MKTEIGLNPKILNKDMKFDMKVDYSKSLDEMIKAGHYEYGDKIINATNFPVIKPFGLTEDIFCVKALIIQPSILTGYSCPSFDQVVKSIYTKSYRPANLAELFAFGKNNPLFQYQEQILCIGSLWYRNGFFSTDIIAVSLGVRGVSRILNIHKLDSDFFYHWSYCCVLVVID